MTTELSMQCLTSAWANHEAELKRWLLHRVGNVPDAEDILHDVFLKSMRQQERFCSVVNARAWLFEVARNTLIDRQRGVRESIELPDDLPALTETIEAIDHLSVCLPRILTELDVEDRDVIVSCDIQGMPQSDFASLKGLSLSATKSRIQRARLRMRQHMLIACQVELDHTGKVVDFVQRT